MALIAVPVMAQQNAMGSSGGVDILGNGLGNGIFESDGNAFQFPAVADTNFDSLVVGNDKATSFGQTWGWPHSYGPANAVNNLEIKKNQDSGPCNSCCTGTADEISPEGCAVCQDACLKANIEQIKLGNREVMAFGFANAANNIKIVTNQV
jgi:hypothetical protein